LYRESYVTGRYFYGALWFLVTQTDIMTIFLASRDFRGGGGGLAKSRRGGGGD